MERNKVKKFVVENKFLIFVMLMAFFLMFTNLGNRYLQPDETHTALFSKGVLETGKPYVVHNDQTITYAHVNNLMYNTSFHPESTASFLWIEQPWLDFYVCALSFKLFGISNFSAKFLFAIIGLATVFLFYFFSLKISDNKSVAKISTLILATSTVFYLYSRQSRYFSSIMFLTIAVLYAYLNLIENKKHSQLFLTLSLAFLFHSHFGIFLGMLITISLHFLLFKHYKTHLKPIIISYLLAFLLTAPWFIWANVAGFYAQEVSFGWLYFFYVGIGFLYLFIILGLPFIFIPFLPKLLNKKHIHNYALIFLSIITFILVISLHFEPPQMRYLIAFLPLICLINGAIIYKIGKAIRSKKVSNIIVSTIVLLMIFTNLLAVFPLNFLPNLGVEALFEGDEFDFNSKLFMEKAFKVKPLMTSYLYEITHDYDSAGEVIANYLQENSKPTDTIISEVPGIDGFLMYYTNLKYATPLDTTPPTWVILWASSSYPPESKIKQQKFIAFIDERYGLENYQKVVLNHSNSWSAETPNPIHHKFKTDLNGTITLYHLKNNNKSELGNFIIPLKDNIQWWEETSS